MTDTQHKTDDVTGPPTIIEEIEVEARHAFRRVQELLREGNIRTLRVKDKKGKYLLEVPLTVGVIAGGAFAFTAPWAIALSALGVFLMDVKIEVVRDAGAGSSDRDSSQDVD